MSPIGARAPRVPAPPLSVLSAATAAAACRRLPGLPTGASADGRARPGWAKVGLCPLPWGCEKAPLQLVRAQASASGPRCPPGPGLARLRVFAVPGRLPLVVLYSSPAPAGPSTAKRKQKLRFCKGLSRRGRASKRTPAALGSVGTTKTPPRAESGKEEPRGGASSVRPAPARAVCSRPAALSSPLWLVGSAGGLLQQGARPAGRGICVLLSVSLLELSQRAATTRVPLAAARLPRLVEGFAPAGADACPAGVA